MPFEPPMAQIIASEAMTRTRPDNVQVPITVNIGMPQQTPISTGLPSWYCSVQILGIQNDDKIYTYFGESSAEALGYAIEFPGELLSALPFANEIDASIVPNFGFPLPITLPPNGPKVSGTVQLEACNDPAQNITFEFRTPGTSPHSPTNPVPALQTIRQVLTPISADTGSFSLPGVPDGTYDLAIKGFCWLRQVLPNIVVNGADVTGLSASLAGGDLNNDNMVDVLDFGDLANNYGTMGDP